MAALEIPLTMLREANRLHELVGHVKPGAHREPLVCDGQVVGFVSPRETPWGRRLGPIFVAPSYRRRGLVLAVYAAAPDVTFCAFVANYNVASRAMHEKAGFVNWRPGNGGWFMRRGPVR